MGEKTRFLQYNKGMENPVNPNGFQTHYLWEEVLTPTSVLDLIENFVHIREETEKEYDPKVQKAKDPETLRLQDCNTLRPWGPKTLSPCDPKTPELRRL